MLLEADINMKRVHQEPQMLLQVMIEAENEELRDSCLVKDRDKSEREYYLDKNQLSTSQGILELELFSFLERVEAAFADETHFSVHRVYTCILYSAGDEIISKKSLLAVKESISFLKQHAREEGLFRRSGRRQLRRKILSALTRGEKPQLENIEGAALECAAALQLFLSRLKLPVMPHHVQQLILADNPGVSPRIVARDALGLIRQDVNGRHGELLNDLLGMLRHLTLAAPPSECSELQGSPLPVALLPVFFTLTPADLLKWRQVAARFSELITEAPTQLHLDERGAFNDYTIPEESDRLPRIQNLPLFYPTIGLANEEDAHQVGETARVFATPLHRPPAGRLHPVISHSEG